MSFNLRTMVSAIIAQRDGWTLAELVQATVDATPDHDLWEAYRAALHEFVRIELSRTVQEFRPGQNPDADHLVTSGPEQDTQVDQGHGADHTIRVDLGPDTRTDQESADTHSGTVGPGPDLPPSHGSHDTQNSPAGREPNLARSRSMLIRAGFRAQIHAAPGMWKAIQTCTAAELLYAAAECERMADYNANRARQYRRLADLMVAQRAEQAGDLGEAIIQEVFSNE